MIRLLSGDCRDVLATLPAESVQCVVTSPPYYGLRDYQTGMWDGGDAACGHVAGNARNDVTPERLAERAAQYGTGTGAGSKVGAIQFRDTCGKCGAVRVDRQIGLEATPEEYLATMVGVFREVKRVLRSDGCAFVNLGDSYCSATQCVRYELREHLSLSELQNVALAVFGVRITGDEEAGEGAMPQVLPLGEQGEAICGRPDVASQGEQEGLFAAPVGGNSRIGGSEQTDEARRDCGSGGQVRLLRRDDTAIPDAGSHQRRRGGPSEENGAFDDQDLPAGKARGLPEAQVSNPLLQLQLRDRLVRLLSARQFAEHEIPAAVRACFKASATLKPKDLLLMPARLALALQADGWWVRSDIIWHKPNPMPESCRDRPTSAHEHVFLLTKSARYFYDADAVREPQTEGTLERFGKNPMRSLGGDKLAKPGIGVKNNSSMNDAIRSGIVEGGRNLRNVWTIATSPYPNAHFATYPPELAERCIKAGTSERGACAACGKPWVRTTERVNGNAGASWHDHVADQERGQRGGASAYRGAERKAYEANGITTTGWSPGCQCEQRCQRMGCRSSGTAPMLVDGVCPKCGTQQGGPVPCTVLDPFAGAGTTLLVADRLQRDAIGIDLNTSYTTMAMARCQDDAPLLTEISQDTPAPDLQPTLL